MIVPSGSFDQSRQQVSAETSRIAKDTLHVAITMTYIATTTITNSVPVLQILASQHHLYPTGGRPNGGVFTSAKRTICDHSLVFC